MRYLRYPPPWHTAAAGLPVLAANSINLWGARSLHVL